MRVRFAPSPTGGLHIGGLRTALFNYLLAKKEGGQFILRIEDTDQGRFVEGAESYIVDCLKWIGITPDEGPGLGGAFGPYRQSERKALYAKYAEQLVKEEKAYYSFDTPEALEKMREDLAAAGVVKPQYNATSRLRMDNSLTWEKEKVDQWIAEGKPYVIRLKIPAKGDLIFEDLVRGKVRVDYSQIDDKILMKSDGMPTYHMANVVDDYSMKITHVVRGEEWLPSAAFHNLLYIALGWEGSMPQFAHIPLILKPTGNGKLSKRDADKAGFPIFPLTWSQPGMSEPSVGFKENGYLPEAMVNFLALLGWNPGNNEELFSLSQLEKSFSIERIVKSGARFDLEKAKWFNQQYIKEDGGKLLTVVLNTQYPGHEKNEKVGALFVERISFPHEIVEASRYLYVQPEEYQAKIAKKKWKPIVVDYLKLFVNKLEEQQPQTADQFSTLLNQTAEEKDMGLGKVMQGVRLSITGVGGGPDLNIIMEILGYQTLIDRINIAFERLGIGE